MLSTACCLLGARAGYLAQHNRPIIGHNRLEEIMSEQNRDVSVPQTCPESRAATEATVGPVNGLSDQGGVVTCPEQNLDSQPSSQPDCRLNLNCAPINDGEGNPASLVILGAANNQELALTLGQGDGPLTAQENDRLQELEVTIEQGKGAWIQVGNALVEIQAQRLYRQDYSTFKDYCQKKWGFTAQHGNRLIGAAKVRSDVSPMGDMALPDSERALRPLTTLRSKQDRVKACKIASSKGKATPPTAKDIQQAVEAVKAEKPEVYAAPAALPCPDSTHTEEREPAIELPAGYPSKNYPSFAAMWGWAKTVKSGMDLETVDIRQLHAIDSLLAGLYSYRCWQVGPQAYPRMVA